MASPTRPSPSGERNERRLAVRRTRVNIPQLYPGQANITADLGDTSDKENQEHHPIINSDDEEVYESPTKPPARAMSSVRKRHIKAHTARTSRRSVSGEQRLAYIDHLESELESAQSKLAAATSSTLTRQNGRRLMAALSKAKNLELCIEDWEKRYDERIQEKVDEHNIEKKVLNDQIKHLTSELRSVEELLEQKQTMQLEKAIEEVKAKGEAEVQQAIAHHTARAAQVESLLAMDPEDLRRQLEVCQAALTLQAAKLTAEEQVNQQLAKRLEIVTDLFSFNGCGGPNQQTSSNVPDSPTRRRGKPRPESMLPRFPTTGNLLASPERRPIAFPAVNIAEWYLDDSSKVDANNSTAENHSVDGFGIAGEHLVITTPSTTRSYRPMRRFEAGGTGPRPLILPSTSSTNSSHDGVPATAPMVTHGMPSQFPFTGEEAHEFPSIEERIQTSDQQPSSRRRASTMIERLTFANLHAATSTTTPSSDVTSPRHASSQSRTTEPSNYGSLRNRKNLLEELQACSSYVGTEDEEGMARALEEGREEVWDAGEEEWRSETRTVRGMDDTPDSSFLSSSPSSAILAKVPREVWKMSTLDRVLHLLFSRVSQGLRIMRFKALWWVIVALGGERVLRIRSWEDIMERVR